MNGDLGQIIRDVPLRTVALGIALGYALLQTAQGVATFFEDLSVHGSAAHEVPSLITVPQYNLNWVFGGHVFAFGQLVFGLLELGTVLLVAALVRR